MLRGNKDENIAGFIAVLIIKSIKYGPGRQPAKRNGKNIADSARHKSLSCTERALGNIRQAEGREEKEKLG